MTTIICAGLIALDLVLEIRTFPTKGTKNRANCARIIGGGGALNAAMAIGKLGGTARLAGAIGDDMFGAQLRDICVQARIDHALVKAYPGLATPYSAIVVTEDGERTIINHRQDALFSAGYAALDETPFDAVLVDTRWPVGALDVIAAAGRLGKPAIVDAEAPVMIAKAALCRATHIAFSEQGLADVCEGCGAEALISAQSKFGGWVAVTRGAKPVLCYDGATVSEVATFETKGRDTLGAGDVWHGAFGLALAQGQPELDAVRWANAAAALKVERSAQVDPLPTACEVDGIIRNVRPCPP